MIVDTMNVGMGTKGMWVHEWVPLKSQWLVLRIDGTDFLHCWVANSIWLNSIWLERAESLITKR